MTKAQRRARVKAIETKVVTGWRKTFWMRAGDPIPDGYEEATDLLWVQHLVIPGENIGDPPIEVPWDSPYEADKTVIRR